MGAKPPSRLPGLAGGPRRVACLHAGRPVPAADRHRLAGARRAAERLADRLTWEEQAPARGRPSFAPYYVYVGDLRICEQCGTEFAPRREHSRFCSPQCRLAWNSAHALHAAVSWAALDWSLTAMTEATSRLAREALDPRHAAVAVSDAVWWVTIVDSTLVRYHPDSYDATLDEQPPLQRDEIEQTLEGLRY